MVFFKNLFLWMLKLRNPRHFYLYFFIVLALCITNQLGDETSPPTILPSDSSSIESNFQLEINPNKEYIYTLQVSNTNRMEFSVKMPDTDCNGSIFLRTNFEKIPEGDKAAKCEVMEFRWKGTNYFVKDLNMSDPISIGYLPGNTTKITYNTSTPIGNVKDGLIPFSFPCKPKFEGGSEGLPYYFTLQVSATGFTECNAGIALVGVEEYEPPTTTIPSTTTKTTKKTTTKIKSTTPEVPTVPASNPCLCSSCQPVTCPDCSTVNPFYSTSYNSTTIKPKEYQFPLWSSYMSFAVIFVLLLIIVVLSFFGWKNSRENKVCKNNVKNADNCVKLMEASRDRNRKEVLNKEEAIEKLLNEIKYWEEEDEKRAIEEEKMKAENEKIKEEMEKIKEENEKMKEEMEKMMQGTSGLNEQEEKRKMKEEVEKMMPELYDLKEPEEMEKEKKEEMEKKQDTSNERIEP